MKRFLSTLILLLVCLSTHAELASVTVSLTDFGGTAHTSRRFFITPLGITTNENGVTSLDRKEYTLDETGTCTVNLAWPLSYNLLLDGPLTKTPYTFTVTTNGTFSFRQRLTTSIASPSGSTAYTVAAADATFQPLSENLSDWSMLSTNVLSELSGGEAGAVDSVNGQTGAVSLDTSHISEAGGNFYFTLTRSNGIQAQITANAANLGTATNNLQAAIDTKASVAQLNATNAALLALINTNAANIDIVSNSAAATAAALSGYVSSGDLATQLSSIQASVDAKADPDITNGLAAITYVDAVDATLNAAINGKANSVHDHAAGDITSGVLGTTRLASGTASEGFVPTSDGAGNVSWAAVPSGGGGGTIDLDPTQFGTNGSDQVFLNTTATTNELSYVHGVTSAIQTQLDGKVAKAGDTMTGALTLPTGSASAPSLNFAGTSNTGVYRTAGGFLSFATYGSYVFQIRNGIGVIVPFGSAYSFATTATADATTTDSGIRRETTGTLGQRSTTTPQSYRLYNTHTDDSNYGRLSIGWSGNVLTIKPEVAGTGTGTNAVYHTTPDVFWRSGTGSPEGVVSAGVGSLWTRTDGGAGTTLYVKEPGTSTTGWVAK